MLWDKLKKATVYVLLKMLIIVDYMQIANICNYFHTSSSLNLFIVKRPQSGWPVSSRNCTNVQKQSGQIQQNCIRLDEKVCSAIKLSDVLGEKNTVDVPCKILNTPNKYVCVYLHVALAWYYKTPISGA